MKNFFKENKVFIIIIIGALIGSGVIYFISQKSKEETIGIEKISSCQDVPDLPDGQIKLVTKIIDGDTFLIEGGYSVRILGIDADERGYPCYEVAKNRLEELVLNKKVKLERGKENLDQYCRYLRYVFLNSKNISLELLREGLVLARFSPEDLKYQKEIIGMEEEAKNNKIGCKWVSLIEMPTESGEIKIIAENKNKLEWKRFATEKTGFDVIGACSADKYVGRKLIVEGKVVDTYRDLKSNTIFLNFGKAYPSQCFTGVIFGSNLYKFVQKPEDYYLNKTLRILGQIKEYKGRPEIILENPSQIEIGK